MENRNLVSFFELSEKWQKEAISNLDQYAENAIFIEPLEHQDPDTHALLDLTDCVRVSGSEYDGVIGVSNNIAIGVVIHDDNESVDLYYLS